MKFVVHETIDTTQLTCKEWNERQLSAKVNTSGRGRAMWENIAISLLALGSTLSAFGGETWKKGDQSFLSRVTRRGWISLLCLLVAFALGVHREVRAHADQQASAQRLEKAQAAQQAATEHEAAMQARLEQTQIALDDNIKKMSDVNFVQLEASFNSISNVARDVFHGLLHLTANPRQEVIGDDGSPLVLYAGDKVSLVLDTKRYAIVGLVVGEHSYQLNAPTDIGVMPTEFAVEGRHSEPMSVYVINPDQATGAIKWFVSSTTTIRQDAAFKEILARAPVPDREKSRYKVINTLGTLIYRTPNKDAPIIERPEPGFLVKEVLKTAQWTEIAMPGGRQGWVLNDALAQLL